MNFGNNNFNKLFIPDREKKYKGEADFIDPLNTNNSLSYIVNAITKQSTVLDVGCAYGYVGEWLTKNKNCSVYGIDIDKEALDFVKKKGYYIDVFNIDLDYPYKNKVEYEKFCGLNQIFDFIICADVLEHLKDPTNVLAILSSKLKYGGQIVISVPNISHIDIILNLIEGKFNYSDYGILDNTHLRFFSKRSFGEWISYINDFFAERGFIFDLEYLGSTKYLSEFVEAVKNNYKQVFKLLVNDNSDLLILQNIFLLTKLNKYSNTYNLDNFLKTVKTEGMIEKIGKFLKNKDRDIEFLEKTIIDQNQANLKMMKEIKKRNIKLKILTKSFIKKEKLIKKQIKEIDFLKNKIKNLDYIVIEKENTINNLLLETENKQKYIEQIENDNKKIKNQLNNIYNSDGWKFLIKYYSIRDLIFPEKSIRKRVVKLVFRILPKIISIKNLNKAIRFIKVNGIKAFICKIKFKTRQLNFDNSIHLLKNNASFTQLISYSEYITEDKAFPVDIIIPIYNALEDLEICYKSVIQNTNLKKHRLVLINDCSTDPKIKEFLDLISNEISDKKINITIIDNIENVGFVKSVNIGMRYSTKDVVLLNSDTIVTKNWIEKLQYAAYSNPKIATVTPFSNNATICSLPKFLEDNPLPPNYSIDKFAKLVERISLLSYPEIPTAVGFCMYIKREVLKDIGFFDEIAFEKGYGEENDFCMRAFKKGYINILCDNLFIYHKGGQSFTKEIKKKKEIEHLNILKKLHPGYFELVEKFIQSNPLKYYHDSIKEILALENRMEEGR